MRVPKAVPFLVSGGNVALLVSLLWRQRATKVPESLILESGIVYGKGGEQPLLLDLTRPKTGKGPFPAIVMIHGGGWVGGERDSFRPFQFYFSQMGIVCLTIDYRLAPKDKFPAQIEDCKAAVRWLRANARKYNVDTTRVAGFGGSAGAHLTALLGTTNGQKRWEGRGGNPHQSSAICAMICLSGPYDLVLAHRNSVRQRKEEGGAVRGMLEAFLGVPPDKFPALYREASPITYASKNTVPAFLTHGTADPLVPIEQSEVFYQKLKGMGVEVDLMRIEGAGHADFGKDPMAVLARATAFVQKHLHPTTPAPRV